MIRAVSTFLAVRDLDRLSPGWYVKIDMSRLTLYSIYDCVLGQVYSEVAKRTRYTLGAQSFSVSGYDYAIRVAGVPRRQAYYGSDLRWWKFWIERRRKQAGWGQMNAFQQEPVRA